MNNPLHAHHVRTTCLLARILCRLAGRILAVMPPEEVCNLFHELLVSPCCVAREIANHRKAKVACFRCYFQLNLHWSWVEPAKICSAFLDHVRSQHGRQDTQLQRVLQRLVQEREQHPAAVSSGASSVVSDTKSRDLNILLDGNGEPGPSRKQKIVEKNYVRLQRR
jgi:hypothetical protein